MARVSTVDAFPTLPTGISNVPSVPAHVDFSAVAGVPAIVLLLRFLLLLVRMLLLPPCSCCSFQNELLDYRTGTVIISTAVLLIIGHKLS